jgi:hypothetical protein
MGSGLSPNGLALSEEGVLSMALMDKVVKVDKEKKQVGGASQGQSARGWRAWHWMTM